MSVIKIAIDEITMKLVLINKSVCSVSAKICRSPLTNLDLTFLPVVRSIDPMALCLFSSDNNSRMAMIVPITPITAIIISNTCRVLI